MLRVVKVRAGLRGRRGRKKLLSLIVEGWKYL
jgi:hypothetical protein